MIDTPRQPPQLLNVSFNGNVLEWVSHIKDLCLVSVIKLTFRLHIDQVSNKWRKMLGIVGLYTLFWTILPPTTYNRDIIPLRTPV